MERKFLFYSEKRNHPLAFLVQGSCILVGLAAHYHKLHIAQMPLNVHCLQHGLKNDVFMNNGKRIKERQPLVCLRLVFHGAAHGHILVAVAPVVGDAVHKPLNAFRQKEEPQVRPISHHAPAINVSRRSSATRMSTCVAGSETCFKKIFAPHNFVYHYFLIAPHRSVIVHNALQLSLIQTLYMNYFIICHGSISARCLFSIEHSPCNAFHSVGNSGSNKSSILQSRVFANLSTVRACARLMSFSRCSYS